MNLADFKQLVGDYMNRAGAAFDVDTPGRVDKVMAAANNAKLFAQKMVTFESARTYCQLVVDKETGGDLSTAVDVVDEVSPVSVHSITQAFLPTVEGVYVPVGVVQYGPKMERFRKEQYIQIQTQPLQRLSRIVTGTLPEVVKDGNKLWVMPWPGYYTSPVLGTTQILVKLRVVQWMRPYTNSATGVVTDATPGVLIDINQNFITAGIRVGDVLSATDGSMQFKIVGVNETTLMYNPLGNTISFPIGAAYQVGQDSDFFLDYCTDWMLYKCIQELNFYLKEDQRVQLSQNQVAQAWEGLRAWNASYAGTETDLDLD